MNLALAGRPSTRLAVGMISIQKMTPEYIEQFHRCLDRVARERKFLSFTEAPILELTEEFVMDCIRNKDPQFPRPR